MIAHTPCGFPGTGRSSSSHSCQVLQGDQAVQEEDGRGGEEAHREGANHQGGPAGDGQGARAAGGPGTVTEEDPEDEGTPGSVGAPEEVGAACP